MPNTGPDSIAISIAFANQQHLVFKAEEGFYEFKTSVNIQKASVSDIARKPMVLPPPVKWRQ